MKTYLPLLLLCCLIGFSSCTEEIEVADNTPLTSAEYLAKLDQPIIFQVIQMDEEENWESGWIIDDKGNIHVFSENGRLAQNQENMDCPGTFVMESLLEYTDGIIGQVDLADLAGYHQSLKEIKAAGQSELTEEQPSNLAFYGLKRNASTNSYLHNSGSNCDGNGSISFEMTSIDYINLKKETANGSISNSPLAAEIVDWMMQVDEEL